MAKPKESPDAALNENLAVITASLELGAATLQKVMGSDAVSNHIRGEAQSVADIQELLASRLAKHFGG
jgi:hypothetical protein